VLYAFIAYITYLSQSCFPNHYFKYSVNTLWERSIDLLDCDLYAVVLYMVLYILHAIWRIIVYEIRALVRNAGLMCSIMNIYECPLPVDKWVLSCTIDSWLVTRFIGLSLSWWRETVEVTQNVFFCFLYFHYLFDLSLALSVFPRLILCNLLA